jgi:hypothetical protein
LKNLHIEKSNGLGSADSGLGDWLLLLVSSVKRISGALEAGAGTTALGSRPAEYQSSRAAACRSVEAGDQSPDQAASGKRPAAVGRGQPADPVLLPAGCSADPWRWNGAAAELCAERAAVLCASGDAE